MTTIVVIGNVTMDQARTAIDREFGSWKARGPKPPVGLPPVPKNQPASLDVPNGSRVQADVTLAETLPVTRSDPDYYSLNLGAQVLGGAFYASRFSRDLRENAGLVYDVSSSLEAGPTRAFYIVNYGCDPENVSKVRAIVERDLKEMQTELVSEQALNQAKVQLLKQIPLSEASVKSIAEGLLDSATSETPLDESDVVAAKYAGLTPRDVQAAFAKWIRPHDFVQVTQGPDTK
jgi:zinc protease